MVACCFNKPKPISNSALLLGMHRGSEWLIPSSYSYYVITSYTDYIILLSGCPAIVRIDHGTENGLLAAAQIGFRSSCTDDYATSSGCRLSPSLLSSPWLYCVLHQTRTREHWGARSFVRPRWTLPSQYKREWKVGRGEREWKEGEREWK